MSMELLAMPFIDTANGGYYREADAVRSRAELLEGIILFFPHCASVDAFQQWIYLNDDGRDADARDRKWLELRRRFEGTSVEWDGLEPERIARWYQQPHFSAAPSTTSSTGSLSSARCRCGATACAIRTMRCATTEGRSRSARQSPCPSCSRRPARGSCSTAKGCATSFRWSRRSWQNSATRASVSC